MNSGATAIARTKVSAPTQWIIDHNYLHGYVCNFGEGKAFKDTEAIAALPEVDKVYAYEPNGYNPTKQKLPGGCPFTFVMANYVLNTLTPAEREDAFVEAFLSGMYSIFTVRIDKVEGEPMFDGVVTQRGTFQTQLKAEEWIIWFYDTMQSRLAQKYRVNILHKTRSYLMVEVY